MESGEVKKTVDYAAMKRKNMTYYLHCLVMIAILVAFWFLPPFGTITAVGMKVLGFFINLWLVLY